ncbi:MAG: MerR family transcriptional regulator, partial [Thermoleophilia bacterium]|nr:MerR family transcriptional regulator [Thermoleophilia bacterium]
MTRIGSRARKPEGPWLSVSAAARALGVSPSTLRLWASEGRVPNDLMRAYYVQR